MDSVHETSSPPSTDLRELAPLFTDQRLVVRHPGYQDPRRATLRPLLWVLVALASLYFVLHMLRPLVHDLQYASSYAQEKARVDAALEGLERLDIDELSMAFRLVAQRTSPSVVQVRTERRTRRDVAIDEPAVPLGVPRNFRFEGQGSGVIVEADGDEGYIVTNNHVVEGAQRIWVHLSDGRELPADLVGIDKLTDLAVLRVSDDGLIAIPWGDSEMLEPGDMVWAVGSPFGLEQSVTFGIVSAKGRHGPWSTSHFQNFLQTDAAVNPGNSGGPLVNIRGEVVGVNTAIVGQSYQGISFAIPSMIAKSVYDGIRAQGRVSRGWLGVSMQKVTPDVAEVLGLPEARGVWVPATWGVLPGSPAHRGGIQGGDVIVGWNSQPVDNPKMLSQLVASTEIASRAEVRLIRHGQEMTLEVTVARRTYEDR